MTMATKIVLMNDGIIQQVGKPEEFYDKPANIFVAQFIGSPTMNMINGKISNGKFLSDNGLITITPEEKDLEPLSAYEGKAVSAGIRSERFVSGGDSFECTIDVVEMLGKEKTLYAKLDDGSSLVISMPGHYQYQEGERHRFGFDLEALHFFDTDTAKRIN